MLDVPPGDEPEASQETAHNVCKDLFVVRPRYACAQLCFDPFDNQDNSGSVTVDHELPRDFSDNLAALPRTITATVTPQGEAHYKVASQANVDHTGSIHLEAHVDIDDSKLTKLEDVVIDSRWKASGAGRADPSACVYMSP